MADNNNAWLGKLPKNPHPALKQLEPLIGTWKVSGPNINGEWRYEWMEGGFFMIQHFNHRHRKHGTERAQGVAAKRRERRSGRSRLPRGRDTYNGNRKIRRVQ
jgi:hypothetical protein